MRIFTKLLLTLLLASALLLSALYWLIQASFDRGLLNYVNQREQQSLVLLSENLARYYLETGSWQRLSSSGPISEPQRKRRANHSGDQLKRSAPNHRPSQRPRQREGFGPKQQAQRPRQSPTAEAINHRDWRLLMILSDRGLRYPDDIDLGLNYLEAKRASRPLLRATLALDGPNQAPTNTPAFPNTDSPRFTPPFAGRKPSLLDANKKVLIGRYQPSDKVQAIIADEKTVGIVAMAPQQVLTDSFDINFAQQIRQNIALILASLFALMLVITIPLSRHFLKPIAKLKDAIVLLNQGQLTTRVKVNRNDEIATLARNLNDLAATLEQNESSRKRWIADIAHELRTPLSILKGELEAFEDGIRVLNLDNLASIHEEVNHLQKLISDLNELNNSEIGTLNYHKQNLDIIELIKQNVARHQYLFEQNQLNFVLNAPSQELSVWADETRLNQLLDNLLTNSVKYTDRPGELTLSVEKQTNSVEITLEDSAPGVPNEALEQLFDHLFRVENSRNRKTGGLGIGLALAKNIVHAHQGEITARNSQLGGLAIVIKLPLV